MATFKIKTFSLKLSKDMTVIALARFEVKEKKTTVTYSWADSNREFECEDLTSDEYLKLITPIRIWGNKFGASLWSY